jgi:hypothetical protein
MNTDDINITEQTANEPQNGEILVEYTSDENYNSAIAGFKEELNKQITFSNESNDWKEIKKRLTDVKDRLKALFLKDDDNAAMNEIINNAFENTNKRQSEEQEKFELESQQNYDSVIEGVKESLEFAETNTDYKAAREKLLAAQESFKNLRMKRSHRDELYKFVQNGFDVVSRRQSEERENYEMECIENYHSLKNKIDAAIEFATNSKIFAESRKALINVQNLIKGLKLKREQRDELYKIIRDTFDNVNTRQEEDRKNFETETVESYNSTKKIVDEAINFAKTSEEFGNSRERLIEAQNSIKGAKLKREQRDEFYAAIREIFDEINTKQSAEREVYESECSKNFQKLTEKVNDCFGLVHGLTEFNLIRESLITVQGEVKIAKLKKEQRNELFSRIREAFSVFDKKKNEYFEHRKEDKSKKLNDIKSNLEDKINRLNDVLAKDLESLELQKAKLNDSDSDEFMISEINKKIENIELRVKEKQDSIEQTQKRISEIDLEISSL